MTASSPALRDDTGVRAEIAAAAVAAAGCRRDVGPVGVPFCAAHDEDGNPPWDRCRWVAALNALLPIVQRLIADELRARASMVSARAADEERTGERDAADALDEVSAWLLARAAVLDPTEGRR